MSIDPARIEAAARAIAVQHGVDPDQEGPAVVHAVEDRGDGIPALISDHRGPLWRMWVDDAKAAIEAAFPEFIPEIFDGLPHAWIAPWEATLKMTMFPEGYCSAQEWQQAYRAMRDAHLSREQAE